MSDLFKYHCLMNCSEQTINQVEAILVNIFGQPSIENEYFTNLDIISLDENANVKGFKVIATEIQIGTLKQELSKVDISFDDIFTENKEHFHPYCILDKEHHEGIAYKSKTTEWDVYYVEGPLLKKFSEDEEEHYIFSVLIKDIINETVYNYMNKRFDYWVREKNIDGG